MRHRVEQPRSMLDPLILDSRSSILESQAKSSLPTSSIDRDRSTDSDAVSKAAYFKKTFRS